MKCSDVLKTLRVTRQTLCHYVKEALENGEAHYEQTLGKEIYLYDLEKRRKSK